MHVNFLENKPNVAGKGHAWMFDLDHLTNSMNYEPVSVHNQANKYAGPKEANNSAGTQANDDQSADSEEIDLQEEHFVLPIWSAYATTVKSLGDKIEKNTDFKTSESLRKEATHDIQNANTISTNLLNTVSTLLSTAGPSRAFNDGELSYPDDPSMPHLKDIYASLSEGIFTDSSYDDEDSKFSNKVYKVVKSLYGLHQAPRAWYAALSTFLEKSRYRRGAIDKPLFIKQDKKDIMIVKQKEDGIFISQDKYVAKILKKFDFLSVKTTSTLIETQKPLVKDEEAADVDVHLYSLMISSLMYLTASRPDIMFAVCACF
nr:hypothetical protein [Tanacetum cinerariifolium]